MICHCTYYFTFNRNKPFCNLYANNNGLLGLKEGWYLRREEWQALKQYEQDFLNLPVQYVIIGHSAGNYCKDKYACIKSMLIIQEDHLKRGFEDIGPNFLVGGNGILFEGRGANVVGAMVKSWNVKSISIMFMGDYRTNNTVPEQFAHIDVLLEKLVEKNVLVPNFVLYGHCQVATHIISPGPKIMKQLRNLTNWNNMNEDKCLPGWRNYDGRNETTLITLHCPKIKYVNLTYMKRSETSVTLVPTVILQMINFWAGLY